MIILILIQILMFNNNNTLKEFVSLWAYERRPELLRVNQPRVQEQQQSVPEAAASSREQPEARRLFDNKHWGRAQKMPPFVTSDHRRETRRPYIPRETPLLASDLRRCSHEHAALRRCSHERTLPPRCVHQSITQDHHSSFANALMSVGICPPVALIRASRKILIAVSLMLSWA